MSDDLPMLHPEFDGDGYPTARTLLAIKGWPITKDVYKNFKALLNFVGEAWYYPDAIYITSEPPDDSMSHDEGDEFYHVSTMGWSGNEDIIRALQDSMFWMMCWWSSRRGGHYVFRLSAAWRKTDE